MNIISEDQARILQSNVDGYVEDGFIMSRAALDIIQKLLDANDPTGRTRVDIEHIQYLQQEKNYINSFELDKIDFYWQNKPVFYPDHEQEEFKFMGLNNTDIIDMFEFTKR